MNILNALLMGLLTGLVAVAGFSQKSFAQETGEESQTSETQSESFEITAQDAAEVAGFLSSLLPEGTYTGILENGRTCAIKVAPITTPDQDISIEISAEAVDLNEAIKITFEMKPALFEIIYGYNETSLRISLTKVRQVITPFGADYQFVHLSLGMSEGGVKSVYIFDRGLRGVTNAKCIITGFEPPAAASTEPPVETTP